MSSGTQKYGLQLRGPQVAATSKKALSSKRPSIFAEDDEDDDVEQAIARQAAKNRALKEVERQHKSALEQDPTIFDYDGVYDEMKGNAVRKVKDDTQQKKPKYIPKLVEKQKAREQEQEIIYERKLLKERQQEDHLYGDKEKFVTSAYKKKLAEQAKWLEEERSRELKEAAEEVTKKSDLSDFYRNLLSKNVAFGAGSKKYDEGDSVPETPGHGQQEKSALLVKECHSVSSDVEPNTEVDLAEAGKLIRSQSETKSASVPYTESDAPERTDGDNLVEVSQKVTPTEQQSTVPKQGETLDKPSIVQSVRKPTQDDLAAAKARYLARKQVRKS